MGIPFSDNIAAKQKTNGKRTLLPRLYQQAVQAQIKLRKIVAILKANPYNLLVAELQDELTGNWNSQTKK